MPFVHPTPATVREEIETDRSDASLARIIASNAAVVDTYAVPDAAKVMATLQLSVIDVRFDALKNERMGDLQVQKDHAASRDAVLMGLATLATREALAADAGPPLPEPVLPPMGGQSGKWLTNDGLKALWADLPHELWYGQFVPETAYPAGALVSNDGNVYLALTEIPSTNNDEPAAGAHWALLTGAGAAGDITGVSLNGMVLTFTKRDGSTQTITLPGGGGGQNLTDEQIGEKAFENPPDDLTGSQKLAVRGAIGAGTSDFSGAYADLTGKPSIPADTTLWRGAWTTLTAYAVGDIVTYNEHVWICATAVPNTNTTAPGGRYHVDSTHDRCQQRHRERQYQRANADVHQA